MTTSTQFPNRAHLKSNWPGIFTRYHRRVKILVQVVLGPFSQGSTDDVIKYVKRHPKNKKIGGVMNVCAASVVESTRWRPSLVTLWLAGRCYKNCRTFFSLVSGGKEKIYFQNLHLWLFEIGVWNRSVK